LDGIIASNLSCIPEPAINSGLLREQLHAFSVEPARFKYIPIWRTYGKYRKQRKCGHFKALYHQKNKDETIICDKTTVWRTCYIKVNKNTK